jgi:hypothetical protein
VTAPANRLSNETPDILIAVFMHRRAKAQNSLQDAKNHLRMIDAQAAGMDLPVAGVKRAIRMIGADPVKLERQERETAMVLRAVRADVEIEQPSLFEATTDESDTARSQRIYRAGWFAAVMAQARVCTMADTDDQHDWMLGYDAFHAALATYELTENKKRRRPATAG